MKRIVHSGVDSHLPYSFSRWTEVPGDPIKWGWFLQRLKEGVFEGIDPVKGTPKLWSLTPEDTQELILWTKNPLSILRDKEALDGIKVSIHVTVNGWTEHERGVPPPEQVLPLLPQLMDHFGEDSLTWRISPLPVGTPERHIEKLMDLVGTRLPSKVYLSFAQVNQLGFPTPTLEEKKTFLETRLPKHLPWKICWDDREAASSDHVGVCSPPMDQGTPVDACGCALAVDPFGVNEGCVFNCSYCYVAVEGRKKHNSIHGKHRLHLL